MALILAGLAILSRGGKRHTAVATLPASDTACQHLVMEAAGPARRGCAIEAVIFDWGDTLMRDLAQYQGAMAHWPHVELIPGAQEALEALRGRFILCVASNAGDSDAMLMGLALERVGIRRYFHHLWTSRELGAAKPDRAFFEAILRNLGLEAEACLMVGNDYEKEIVPAKAVGMQAVWLARPSAARSSAAGAAVRSMTELPQVIHDLTARGE
jgi:putative hydrolase of the HAD superfamily